MKNRSRKQKTIKVTVVSLCSLVGLAAIICLSAYLVMHRYISKVNYVPLEEADSSHTDLPKEEAADSISEYFSENNDSSAGQASKESHEVVETSAANNVVLPGQNTPEGEAPEGTTTDGDGMTTPIPEVGAGSEDQEVAEKLEESIRNNIMNDESPVKREKEVLNLLLIGTDNSSGEDSGLSDSMVLLSINEKEEKITVTSLLRDIYLHIPEKNTYNRLNTAYAFGGARLLVKTIEENFKVKIDKYASVDLYSFTRVIDALGGIELDITEEELPDINALLKELNQLQGKEEEADYLKASGLQLLNGRQALSYSRVRYVGTDFGRTARQRAVLEQIYRKTKKLGVNKITELLDLLLPEITTNFSEREIISQILSFPEYMEYDYDSLYIPMTGTYESLKINGMQVLGIDFEENIKELQKRIYLH